MFCTLFLGGGRSAPLLKTTLSAVPLGNAPGSSEGHAPLPPPRQDPPPSTFGPAPFKTHPCGLFGPAHCLPPPTPGPAPLCSAPRVTLISSPTRKAPLNPARLRLPGRAPRGPPAPHSAARATAWAPPAAILRRLPPPSASAPPPARPALKAQAGTKPLSLGNIWPTQSLLL